MLPAPPGGGGGGGGGGGAPAKETSYEYDHCRFYCNTLFHTCLDLEAPVVVVAEEEVVEVRQLKKCRMNMAIADYIVNTKIHTYGDQETPVEVEVEVEELNHLQAP